MGLRFKMLDLKPAIKIIKQYEGLRLAAYVPPEGAQNGYAIGYGYTRPWVTKLCLISEEWADQLLKEHLESITKDITSLVPSSLNNNQLCAVMSLVYNIGVGAFKDSTLRRKLLANDFLAAAIEFGKWTKSRGEELPGLVKRGAAERQLFERPALVM